MKINDLEKVLGVKRSSIFYYEREGLLAPGREDNNYRDYTETDLRRLKTVVVLRKLGFTVGEIRSLLDGERVLSDVLAENLARLETQAGELGESIALCRELERRGVTMAAFDADAWFEAVETREREGKRFLDLVDDAADGATRTLAFMQERIGFVGPAYALFFFSEEGIQKRRLWKLYWILLAVNYLCLLAMPYIVPGSYTRLASPWAALVFTVIQGMIGSLVLWLCARYVIPGRKPGQALVLTVLLVVGVNLLLGVMGRQVLRIEVDEEARDAWLSSGRTSYVGDDPLGYVQSAFNEKYYGGQAELDVWQDGEEMFIFTSWGAVFRFRALEEGKWSELGTDTPAEDGLLYTADPYGPRKYSSRLMLMDGTVVEPVFEAHFSGGYTPLYVFDVSQGQEYTGLEFGVDETGAYRYEIDRADYVGASVWQAPIDEREWKDQHSTAELLSVDGGAAFLTAYYAWRAAVCAAEPILTQDTAWMGVASSFALYASYIAPPSLSIRTDRGVWADWGLNECTDTLFFGDQGPRLLRQMTCAADVTALITAGTPTPEQLRQAAASAQSSAMIDAPDSGVIVFGGAIPYAAGRAWAAAVPESLCALGSRVFSALNGKR